jgi:hypothetical protein
MGAIPPYADIHLSLFESAAGFSGQGGTGGIFPELNFFLFEYH